jgi:hypothetical protein
MLILYRNEVKEMAKVHSMSINEFMNGEFKKKKEKIDRTQLRVAATSLVPLATVPYITAYAHGTGIEAVPVGSTISQKTLGTIAHALDPVVDLLVAVSFPVASIVIIGSCFYFIFGNSEKAWSGIQNAGLGYILIQVSPLLLNILKEIGKAV